MQKRRRTFLAINLPQDVKKVLAKYQGKFGQLPANWTPQENLHVTLVFLGDLTDEELGEVAMAAKGVVSQHEPFEIYLDKVGYGPDDTLPPKMLWASGQKSKQVSVLRHELEEALSEHINYKPDARAFSPHVTLARISSFAWRQIDPEERPEVSEAIDIMVTVESIDIMESHLGKGGPTYTIIESIELQ